MTVLSVFYRVSRPTFINHRRYARLLSYDHKYYDASVVPQRLAWLYKYELLLSVLRSSREESLVLLMSDSAAIVNPLPIDQFIAEREYLLVRVSSHAFPQVDVQFWRNTHATRKIVADIALRCRLGEELPTAEAKLFEGLETVDSTVEIGGCYPVMHAGHRYYPGWKDCSTFSISVDDAPHDPERKWEVPRFKDALVEHINHRSVNGGRIFDRPEYGACVDEERSVYNSGKPIALVTLYTPAIASYARIAEKNFLKYCAAHDYTLYVHRDIPAEVGLQVSGNWLKPWLLHAYLQHHEWVIWLDSDVLFADLARPLHALLEGRDVLLAHDIGCWDFNAGVMGFRRTPTNLAMLQNLMSVISSLGNLTEVYSNSGDQHYFIEAIKSIGTVLREDMMDFIKINTPWMLRQPDSFIVHYLGMWSEMRALMMEYDLMHG